ncbi:conserved hypothetical protein [Ferroglobus placidus DSM 10642]|uniref:Rubrerythrin diiron-binding domain-containing protein n=1 Tax=Ferroglobus placidus (strain DSM 10642 / AEDII12DO) TaxID=589924 RepID=D3S032_FERPA|nr:ferritin family protein [Ferroglobus placidus]ADC66095.1 conserved hypothetical protein [Ferroglobus placidus DSM 10642]
MTPEQILERAKQLEVQAIKEYNEMKKNADPLTSELLDYLISQEREHLKMIEDRLKALKLLNNRQ